jgi:hypothetical protein
MEREQKQLSEYEGKGIIHIPYIVSLSSLNLRMGRCSDIKRIQEKISYKCSVCGKDKMMGVNAQVMVRMEMNMGLSSEILMMCDTCIDVLTETLRFGPRVVEDARKWVLSSRVARVSGVHEELVCFKCMGRADSHIFVKYDDLNSEKLSSSSIYGTIRVCARCVLSYLSLICGSKVTRRSIIKGREVVEMAKTKVWKMRQVSTVVRV